MRNARRALRDQRDDIPLDLARAAFGPLVEEPHKPGLGMMWAFLISVVLWLLLGCLWAALP